MSRPPFGHVHPAGPRRITLREVHQPSLCRVLAVKACPEDRHWLALLGVEPGRVIRTLHNDGKGTVAVETPGGWRILGRRFTHHVELSLAPPGSPWP